MRVRDGISLLVFSLLVSIGHRVGLFGLARIDQSYMQAVHLIGYFGFSVCIVRRISDLRMIPHRDHKTETVVGNLPSPKNEPSSDESTVRESGLVDGAWYLSRNPDVAAAGLDPVTHYLESGAAEGRDPNSYFDTKWYINNNPDVLPVGINPFLHYIKHGSTEGRSAGPHFDTSYYTRKYNDVLLTGMLPLLHFMKHGVLEGRVASSNAPSVAGFGGRGQGAQQRLSS